MYQTSLLKMEKERNQPLSGRVAQPNSIAACLEMRALESGITQKALTSAALPPTVMGFGRPPARAWGRGLSPVLMTRERVPPR